MIVRAPEFRREVVTLRREGRSMNEIADLMGYACHRSVSLHLRRHGDPALLARMPRRRVPEPAWWDRAERLSRHGLCDADVAAAVGRAASSVHRMREARGIPPRVVIKPAPGWQDRAVELYRQVLTDREIGARVGRHRSQVAKLRARLGLPAHGIKMRSA